MCVCVCGVYVCVRVCLEHIGELKKCTCNFSGIAK